MGTMRKRKKSNNQIFQTLTSREIFFMVYLCCMLLGDMKKTTCSCHIKHTKLIFNKKKKQDEIIRNIEYFEKESGLLDSANFTLRRFTIQ